MKKETSKRLSAGLLASALILNTVLSISADDGNNYHSAGESGIMGTFTSAPAIMFNTLGASGEVAFVDGTHEKWIDRIDVPSYAVDMYNTISDASFWTNAANFTDRNGNTNLVEASYSNGTSDKFNGLLILESQPQNEDYSDDMKDEIIRNCRAAYDAFDRDNPGIFWLTGETNFKQLVTYATEGDITTYTMKTYMVLKDYNADWDMRRSAYRDTDDISEVIATMDTAVDSIVAGAGGTDYEKIKYFNKYLTENNEYNAVVAGDGDVPDGAAEALCAILGSEGNMGPVCEGYSRAFKVLCDEAGIPCVLTDGTAYNGVKTEAHMWNYAKLGDSWYAVDVTWNDPIGGESGKLSGNENEKYLAVGDNTLVDGETFASSHTVSNKASLAGPSFTNGPVLSADAYTPAENEKAYEAVIGTTKYETLEEAAEAASSDETIKLLDSIIRDKNITIGASGTIDLDGKTINMGDYTITSEKPVTLTDSKGTGSVKGKLMFNDGGTVHDITLGEVYVSGGSFTFTDSKADILSVTGGTVAVSDLSLNGVSSSSDICSILAEGQMYYIDEQVISADKLYGTSLSENITVAEGKAAGIIENKDYETSYVFTGSAIAVPTKENFTFFGADPSFSWDTSGNSVPVETGTYTLTVTSGATDRVSSATRNFTIEITQFTSDAVAVLTGTQGKNGWIVSEAKLEAPDGYQISTDYSGLYADYISITEDTNKSVTYYLKESATGYIIPAQTIDVKVDVTAPVFGSDATISGLTASEARVSISATDGNGSGVSMYLGKLGSMGISSTAGVFNLIDLAPATEYTLVVTAMDVAGNTAEGEIKFTTESGIPNIINAPALTGIYGTAVKNMTISGGSVKYGSDVVDGTWTITDENSADIPAVGTENSYTLTFTPSSQTYKPVTASVVPTVTPLSLATAVVTGVNDSYSYTGDVIKPVVIVTLGGNTLSENDYIVEYGSNINCGEDMGRVTVKGKGNYGESVTVNFDITKVDTELTALSSDVIKNYGDKAFTLDVKTNNPETYLNYRVANTDVVEVSDKGVVTIKGAGTAMILVSQDETTNYKANVSGVSVFVTVLQAEALKVEDVTEKFVYSIKSKGNVDISEVMLEASDGKCGPMTFSAYENSALISNALISDEGILTFDVGTGDVGDKGTVVATVYSQNYEATTIKVVAELTDKFVTKAKSKITAANNITYGQPLSDISFKTFSFVTTDGDPVEGTLAWEKPESIPSVSEKTAVWVFTPDNEDLYEPCTGTASITVKQAIPTVTTPTVEDLVYDSERKLSAVTINGTDGKAVVNGAETVVEGTWSWTKPTTVPNCKTAEYAAVFKPTDSVNYDDVEVKVIINVAKAQAEIKKLPTATAITYGQKISDSTLKNGSANASGKFTWVDGSEIKPAGTYELEVLFTPSDSTNYTETACVVSLTVNKAKNAPNMPSSKISASYDITTVGGVELPEYWNWDYADSQKGLSVGSSATATAVYNGLDKGNYINESIVVTVTRSKCSHKNTKTINVKEATCLDKGYSGDTYCSDCDTITVSGKETAAAGHSGGKATCNALAVCKTCKKTYGEYDKDTHSGTRIIRNAIAPTAVSAGYTGDTCCSACGAVLEKGTVLPVNGSTVTTTTTNNYPAWNVVPTTTAASTTAKTTTTTKATTAKTTAKTTTTTKKTTTTTRADDDDIDDEYDEEAPYIYDNDEQYGWSDIVKVINGAKSGGTVEVDMNYTTELPATALKALKGKNVELVLHMDGYFSWVINGMNVESAKNINMEVVEGDENISVDIVDQVTGDAYSTTLTLTHNGEFGFTTVLRYEAGDPGYYANLYYYNPTKKVATFVTSDKIDDEGFAELTFDHASEYIIVIDEKDHSKRAGIEYDGGEDDSDDEDDGRGDVVIDNNTENDDLFDSGNDYYTGGDKNPATGLGFGHILVGILGVSAFVVRPKNEKRKRKTL